MATTTINDASHSGGGTYEALRAQQTVQNQADPICWASSAAFRNSPYRQLHHQRGLIGTLRVRLLEASDLHRPYWSLLALVPAGGFLKPHLSKAHGPVSSFVSLRLAYHDGEEIYYNTHDTGPTRVPVPTRGSTVTSAAATAAPVLTAAMIDGTNSIPPFLTSPVVPGNNHPVWENCQFDVPLRKGESSADGQRILIHIRVQEDATAVENWIPGLPKGTDRTIGLGWLDVTDLVLGQETMHGTGQALPGVLDAWIPLQKPPVADQEPSPSESWFDQSDDESEANQKPKSVDKTSKDQLSNDTDQPDNLTGLVRLLVSYQPHGLEPQSRDIVALECFARRSWSKNSCRPVLPPLQPLVVLERRNMYLLCEYPATDGCPACIRLHRNAVFVIERQNLVDAAHNLALLPADVWMATPLGRGLADLTQPVRAASQELFMPAVLSGKLLWMAARTTAIASWSGISTLIGTFWHEGAQALTANTAPNSNSHGPPLRRPGSTSSMPSSTSGHQATAASQRRSQAASAKFVQL
jgi:hypothetical protein